MLGAQMDVDEVMAQVETDCVFYRNSGGGVTLSGGEPLMQPEFARKILIRCRELGIHTAVETAGCLPWEYLEMVSDHVDLFLYDLKHPDDTLHKKAPGRGNALIIKNLKSLCSQGSQVIVRVPVIPGVNDSEDQIEQLATLCMACGEDGLKQVELLPYHNLGMHKYDVLGQEYTLQGLTTPEKSHMLSLCRRLETRMEPMGISCQALFGTAL
jgi:pyruvate formate lyase activating enzyme